MIKKWEKMTREEIENLLDNIIEDIFKDEQIDDLTEFEKRKKIYDYLLETKEYDYDYFEGILRNYHEVRKKNRFTRNLHQEFLNPIITSKGISNGFAQTYKLLLERIGIYALCINCTIEYRGEYVGHQLNLVYNKETETYSFDDVSFGIQKHNKEYFNYDNPEKKGQGIGNLIKEIKWAILDETIINYFAKREESLIEPPEILKELLQNKQELLIEDRRKLNNKGIIIKKYDKLELWDTIKKR